MNAARRRLIGAGGAATALVLLGAPGRSVASPAAVEAAIADFGAAGAVEDGTIVLRLPEIAEHGDSVAVSFSVESPMTADDHVESVMILAADNPSARVATFHFTPASGVASAATRIRLSGTQDVIAIAKRSNGSVHRASGNVKVTLGGCGG